MCTVLLPPGDNPIAVKKYIISYKYIRVYVTVKHSQLPIGKCRSFLTIARILNRRHMMAVNQISVAAGRLLWPPSLLVHVR